MESLYEDEDETEELHRARGSLQKLLGKLRKALIVAFSSNSKQSNAYRTRICLSICLACLATLQGMSLILTCRDTMAEYADMENLFALVNYVRVDALAVDLGVEYSFFYVLLAVIYTPVGILVVNLGTFLYWRKKPYWLLVKLMHLLLTGIEQVLLLPALISMVSFIKYTYFSSSATMFEYGNKPQTHQSAVLAATSLITLPRRYQIGLKSESTE